MCYNRPGKHEFGPSDARTDSSCNVADGAMVRLQRHVRCRHTNSTGAVREQWRRTRRIEPGVLGRSSGCRATLYECVPTPIGPVDIFPLGRMLGLLRWSWCAIKDGGVLRPESNPCG